MQPRQRRKETAYFGRSERHHRVEFFARPLAGHTSNHGDNPCRCQGLARIHERRPPNQFNALGSATAACECLDLVRNGFARSVHNDVGGAGGFDGVDFAGGTGGRDDLLAVEERGAGERGAGKSDTCCTAADEESVRRLEVEGLSECSPSCKEQEWVG